MKKIFVLVFVLSNSFFIESTAQPNHFCISQSNNDSSNQGRLLQISWSRSSFDNSETPITEYSIWRKVMPEEVFKLKDLHDIPVCISEDLFMENRTNGWDYVNIVEAIPDCQTYYYTVATSGATLNEEISNFTFIIIAHTTAINTYYKSKELYGYSVENLAENENINTFTENAIFRIGKHVNKEDHLFECYPNPVKNSTTITYLLSTDEHVKLSVLDSYGRVILNLINARQTSGLYSYYWDQINFQNGIYYIHLKAGNTKSTLKILKY